MSGRRAVGVALGLLLAAGAAVGATTQEVLDDLRSRGYTSPGDAVQRLREAPPTVQAPLELRWRYESALSQLALMANSADVAQASIERLGGMVSGEGCAPCAQVLVLRREQVAEGKEDAEGLRQSLAELSTARLPEDPALRFEWFLARATAQATLGERDAAITEGVRALEVATEHGLAADQVMALDVLAVENATRRDVNRALAYSRQGIELARRIGFTYALARLLINHSYALSTIKENKERKATLEELLTLSGMQAGLEGMHQNALINLAALSNDTGEYRQAADYAERAERAANREADPNSYAFALVNRGVAWVHLGRTAEGLALVKSAVEIGRRTGDKRELADLIEQLVDAYETAGAHTDALKSLRQWIALNNEVTASQREAALTQLQETFAAKQRQQEIDRLKLENERREAELQVRAWRERASAGGAMLVALLAIIIWQRLARTRAANRALQGDVARLSDESQHDALTGAYNRRYGEALLQRLALSRPGEQRKVALLLLDVDHFKRVNDTHGHAAGDAVLVEMTRRLHGTVRDGDALVRWGGEEFLLILPGADERVFEDIAARTLAAVGEVPVAVGAASALAVRASAGGVVWITGADAAWSDALALADMALYRAKAQGRNRAVLAYGDTPVGIAEGASLDTLLAAGGLRLSVVAGVAMVDGE